MDFSMRNKTFLLSLIFISALCYLIWLGFYKGDAPQNSAQVKPAEEAGASYTTAPIIKEQAPVFAVESDIKVNTSIEQEWRASVSPVELAQQIDWFRERGNYSFAGDDEYASYGIDTLTRLVDMGDVHAMHALAKLYMSEEYGNQYGIKYAEPLYWKAAVHGSSDALAELAIIESSKRIGKPEDEKRQYLINSMVYYKVAEMRGDKFGYLSAGKSIMKITNTQITESEVGYIAEKANALYEKMRIERESLGLGEFDNSVPDAVKKLFDKLESEAK